MTQPKSNLPASIHRRLLNGARQRGEDFQLTLLRFGAERLLYRLGRSAHAREFVQPAPRARQVAHRGSRDDGAGWRW
jgi:hypothetical protein